MHDTTTADGRRDPTDAYRTFTVDVYHTTWDEDSDAFADAQDLRVGMLDEDDLSLKLFNRAYDYVGSDHARVNEAHDNPRADALNQMWARWNAGSGQESTAFEESEARSMMTGDLLVVHDDGVEHAYLCKSIGWARVERLSETDD